MSAQTDVGSRLITLILTPFPSILQRGNGGLMQDCGEWELAGGKKGSKGKRPGGSHSGISVNLAEGVLGTMVQKEGGGHMAWS